MKKLIAVVFALCFISGSAIAHSGGTDDYGCHTNHDTGNYHCHR